MKRTIYSNYELFKMYDDVKSFLEAEMEEEPTENQIWKEIYIEDEFYWEEAFAELKKYFENKKTIFFGTLGLWYGKVNGGKIGDFETLFFDAIKDCDYWEITDENGHLYLECSHHDGSNYFEIRTLTDKGYDYAENWNYSFEKKYDYSEQEMHSRLIKCSLLSRLPHFWKNVYGI